MWLRNLSQLSAYSDRSQSAERLKQKKRKEMIQQLGVEYLSGGQLIATLYSAIAVKDSKLARLPLLCQIFVALMWLDLECREQRGPCWVG